MSSPSVLKRILYTVTVITLLTSFSACLPSSLTSNNPFLATAHSAAKFDQYNKKPFAILGQRGAIFKRKGQKQQFMILKNMNSLMASYLFGNLKNKLIVQQLASQVIGKTKKGKKLRVQVTSIQTISTGSMKLSGSEQASPYEHVRAHFTAHDPTEASKPAEERTLDVKVIRSAANSSTENIITTYSLDKPTSVKNTEQFLNTLQWESL